MAEEKATSQEEAVETQTTEENVPAQAETEKPTTTKAGKRSAKAIRETEEQVEKQARKEAGDTTPQTDSGEQVIKKGPAPKVRPLIERRSKAYQNVAKQFDSNKLHTLEEALQLAGKTSPVKFDATVEMHVKLNVDPRQADQNIRSTVILPSGTGKTVRIAVFAPENEVDAAKKAGADIVGEDTLLQQLDKEKIDFDVLIAIPQLMPKLGKYARLLGPRGLMPNPKSGTVTTKIADAVREAKAGRVEYRVDKQGIVHLGIGKVSFKTDQLLQNAKAFIDSLNSVKPTGIKGGYIKTVTVSTSMGPGIKVEANDI
jgi:large subunit ribosomal protein L1